MSEPTSAYTIADLVTRVAMAAGYADYDDEGIAIPPVTSPADLAEALGVVVSGIKMFIADAPDPGWQWTHRLMEVTFAQEYTGIADSGSAITLVDSDIADSYADDFFNGYVLKITAGTGKDETATITDFTGLTGTFAFTALSGGSTPDDTSEYRICKSTSCIDSDSGRYLLDGYFGAATGNITYARQTSIGTPIRWTSEGEIRNLRSDSKVTSNPYLAAVRPYGTRQTELIIWPYPSSIKTVVFPYEILFDKAELEAGVASDGLATTLIDSHLSKYADDYFNGWTLTILNGTGKGETATVTDFTQATGTVTFAALSGDSTPDSTTQYMLEPTAKYHPAGVRFDDAILAACRAKGEMDIEQISGGYVEFYHSKALQQAYKLDRRLAPRSVGNLNGSVAMQRNWKPVTYNGS